MKLHLKILLLIIIIVIQFSNPNMTLPIKDNPKAENIIKKGIERKIQTSNPYTLEAYPEKAEFSTQENVIINIFLYDPENYVQITDTVMISTHLGTMSVQLTNFENSITIDKQDFTTGLNTITVSYKDQTEEFTILVRNPLVKGRTSSNFQINDILNKKPAPGVPDYINFTLNNPSFINFPTQENEYVQISIPYGLTNLVLGVKYYQLNEFIIYNQINFSIPGFLPMTSFILSIQYSGDSILQPSTQGISITIHDYTPEITASLTNTIIGLTNVLNETDTYLNVKIQGYLPSSMFVAIELSSTSENYMILEQNITAYRQSIPIAIVNIVPTGQYQLQAIFSYDKDPAPLVITYTITTVNKIGLIIRTNTTIFTLGNPILFDFFSYDPTTFNGIDSIITMLNGSIPLMDLQALGGHAQKIMIFNNILNLHFL